MSLLDKLEAANTVADSDRLWKGSFRDFLKKYEAEKTSNANIGVLAHQRLYNMILAGGTEKKDHFGKERTFYKFFEETLFGIEDSLDDIMTYIHSAAQKTETSRRMLLMYGPPSSGKSCIVEHLKRGLENYTQTPAGAIFALSGSKMHENPFLLIPEKLRGDFEKQYGLYIEGQLSPTATYVLREEYNGKFMDYPVEQIVLTEAGRKGIGTWLPQDPKGQDQSELVGGIDFAKIQEFGDEADPRCYNFNGELNVANRGVMEFIEGLKSLSYGTYIPTASGMKKIGDIHGPEKDILVAHERVMDVNSGEDVGHIIRSCFKGKAFCRKVKTKKGYSFVGSVDHRVKTLNKKGSMEWKPVCELSKGDIVPISTLGIWTENSPKISTFVRKISHPRLKLPKRMTRKMARFLGYYVAEGSYNKWAVCISNVHQYVIDDVFSIAKSFGLNPRYDKKGHSVINSVEMVGFLKGCGLCGNDSDLKIIPQIILDSPKQYVAEFLRAYFDGDGTVNDHRISCTSSSVELIDQLHVLLLNFGIISQTSKTWNEKYEKFYYSLSMDSIYRDLFMKEIGFNIDYKTRKAERTIRERADHRHVIDCPYLFRDLLKELKNKCAEIPVSVSSKHYSRSVCEKALVSRRVYNHLWAWSNGKRSPSVAEVRRILPELPDNLEHKDRLSSLVQGNLHFDIVDEIGPKYLEEIYDVHETTNHSYVGNGLIHHNSDERFLRVLLTATQEKAIKAPRFGLIYCDTVIILHSVHPDELIPIKERGTIKLVQIRSLHPHKLGEEREKDLSKEDIQVLSVDERTRQPVWSNIKRVLCHHYKGDVLQLQQKYGDVLVSPNHSVYNQDFGLFDAKEHDKNELLTISHVPQESVADEVVLAKWCQDIHVEDHLVLKKTAKQATVRSGIVNNISADKVPAFLRILAAYIAEGHLLGPKDAPTGMSISQQSLAWLQSLKTDFEILSDGVKPYLNNREEADDHTSRLEIHSISWAHIIEQLCGRYSYGKKVPDFVFNMSYDMKMLFLGALIEGDGSRKIRSSCFGQEMSEEYLENYFSYTTVSRYLAAGFCFLCKMCGVSVSIHSRSKTSTGKTVYHITYVRYPRNQNTKTADRSDFNGYLYDIEVDTPHAHNFVCGVGSVVCHNTNEEEFRNFMAEKKYEAYHDRMVIVKVPYNLSVSNEVKIYEKLLSKSDAIKNMHIAPKTLQAAAMFSILTRLTPPQEGGELTLSKKMKLYDKQHVRGYKIEQVPDMRHKEPKEGMTGVSPRFTIDQISAAIAHARDENRDYITPLDVLRQMNKGVFGRDSFGQDKKNHFESLIDEARSEWDDLLRNDIQKAFFVSYEKEARNLCENYLDQIDASCAGTKPRDPITGDEIDLDEKLMDSVEEQIDITSSGKEDFRNEILRTVGAAARANKQFDYTQHSQLREAIQKKLFEERKNVIRMTVSTRNPDPDELKKINDVVARMVDQQGYSEAAANALLKYATAHLFDK